MAHEMAGVLAKAEGDRDGALKAFRMAVEVAEGMEPPSGPPGESPIDSPIQPAHELLGDMLLDTGDAETALQVFETSLQRTAKRPHSALRRRARRGRDRRRGSGPPLLRAAPQHSGAGTGSARAGGRGSRGRRNHNATELSLN